MKSIIWLAVVVGVVGLLGIPVASALPTLEFVPAVQSFNLGDSVSVAVRVNNLGAEIVSAYDLDVGYNTGVLSATGVTFANSLGDPSLLEVFQSVILQAGIVDLAEVSLLSDADLGLLQAPFGGTVPLATLTFSALAAGDTSSLLFDSNSELKGLNNQVIYPTVPEPGTLLLLVSGLGLLACGRRKM